MHLIHKLKIKRQKKILYSKYDNFGKEFDEYDILLESLRANIHKLSDLQNLLNKQSKIITKLFKGLNPSKLKEESDKCFEIFKEHDSVGKQFLNKASVLCNKLLEHKNKTI